jgi:hypothetical protein
VHVIISTGMIDTKRFVNRIRGKLNGS